MSARLILARLAVVVPTSGLAALIACGSSSPTKVIDGKNTVDGSGSGSGSVGTTFAGSATNLTFQHYDFPTSGNPTPDPDGCMTTIPAMTFSAPISASGRYTSEPPEWVEAVRDAVRANPPVRGQQPLATPATTCALASTFTPTFTATGSGSNEEASNNGSGSGYTEDLEWQGILGGSGSGLEFLAIQAFAGGGSGSSGTPDWPTGVVTPLSGINVATDPDTLLFIGTDLNGSNQATVIYLGVSGTFNISEAGSD